ncbi:poly(A) polymerase [Dongia mobilis]|uniref:Poly(A) polymerase n=1 Tax=Dongia mobilis TaxID=578943 RepID=A0A4R6X2R2_9PROT|nr:CCA tRNA nucleotidyltransferase [Dongia mobilis]TDQ86382.1 poly(A) polymerase [Dongia mobilis]
MSDLPRIDVMTWPHAAGAMKVLAALKAAGGEGRLVGGAVRDALAGRPVRDIDIATDLAPEAVMAGLEASGLRSVPTGLKHGTVTAIADHVGFEVTTLRHDVETDGRHARVAFTDDWRADAARRDLTINALFCDASGQVHDYFGGVADLLAGRVRFVGDPAQRMDEDYLRILRFFRFHADYAAGPFDADAIAAATARRFELKRLSGERLRQETLKLLVARNGIGVWGEMLRLGFAEAYLPQATSLDRLAKVARLEGELGLKPDPIRRLAALAITGSGPVIGEMLKLSNAERARLDLMSAARPLINVSDPHLVRRQIHDLGNDNARDLLLVDWDDAAPDADWHRAFDIIQSWPKPTFPLAGRDLLKLGAEAGPDLGARLAALEAWWIAGDFAADREGCLAKAREMMG